MSCLKCETQVYQSNINEQSNVCLNILHENGKPVLTINSIISRLLYLFLEPNPNDSLKTEATGVLTNNRKGDVSCPVSKCGSHILISRLKLNVTESRFLLSTTTKQILITYWQKQKQRKPKKTKHNVQKASNDLKFWK